MDYANLYIMYLLILSAQWWWNYNFESDFPNYTDDSSGLNYLSESYLPLMMLNKCKSKKPAL